MRRGQEGRICFGDKGRDGLVISWMRDLSLHIDQTLCVLTSQQGFYILSYANKVQMGDLVVVEGTVSIGYDVVGCVEVHVAFFLRLLGFGSQRKIEAHFMWDGQGCVEVEKEVEQLATEQVNP